MCVCVCVCVSPYGIGKPQSVDWYNAVNVGNVIQLVSRLNVTIAVGRYAFIHIYCVNTYIYKKGLKNYHWCSSQVTFRAIVLSTEVLEL